MGLPEIEALLALCKAAPLVTNIEIAAQLLAQLTGYLPESQEQTLNVPPSASEGPMAPWETLTFNLTAAILSLGLKHPSLKQHASSTIDRYVIAWAKAARDCTNARWDEDDLDRDHAAAVVVRTVTLAVSLQGFLEAAAVHAHFWTPYERLQLIRKIRDSLSESYMISLETALSAIRNSRQTQGQLKTWKHYVRRYAAHGKPLGAMLLRQSFMHLVVACSALEIASAKSLEGKHILELLLSDQRFEPADDTAHEISPEHIAEIAAEELKLLDEGSDYLQLGSAWQQKIASAVKACALECILCCSILDDEVADPEALMAKLEATMSDPVQIADEYLASVVFKSMAILSKTSPTIASSVARILPRVIVQGGLDSKTASIAAQSLALVLRKLPQDATITTLYSLGNVLSARGGGPDRKLATSPYFDDSVKTHRSTLYVEQNAGASVISFGPGDSDEPSLMYLTTIEAIVRIAWSCRSDKIIALAISMLIQKINRLSPEVDAKIITETAILGVNSAPNELRSLLKIYSKQCHDSLVKDNQILLSAVMRARLYLSQGIKRGTALFEIYLLHLLDSIVSKGDAHDADNKHHGDVELAAREIGQLLRPLAILAANNAAIEDDLDIEGFNSLQRDAWFNVVVHGFTLNSPLGKAHRHDLQILAQYSHPLVAEDRSDHLEGDIELNTTLRRGKSSEHANEYKRQLIEALPECENHIKDLNYSETIFLASAYLVESLRAQSGDCTKILTYFLDPVFKSGHLNPCMVSVAAAVVKTYLSQTLAGKSHNFTSPYVAQQLALFFAGCCHRIAKVQEVAIACADLIVSQVPSALCHKSSLFALLELLTLMYQSAVERDTNEYEWRSKYSSSLGNVELELSDDYKFRERTLNQLRRWAETWVRRVLDIAPLDIKGLIQTYLAESGDEGTFGKVYLGRSFAFEMGTSVPSTDQRLGAIERQPGLQIDTTSDFVAQYTTRQEYRYIDSIRDDDQEWVRYDDAEDPSMRRRARLDKSIEDARSVLADLEGRTLRRQHVSIAELRDVLRRAGALLCKTEQDQGAIVHHLVGIPFAVFSKQAMKLGISLWTGVIKENARMESRILVEIAECWEGTIRQRRGLFDAKLLQPDPFYVKEEFAPSDRNYIARRQHVAYDLIAPHFYLAQFLSSHFNGTRLGSPYIQRIYQRLINITLDALTETKSHPLARETHFHLILLGLRILRYSSNLDPPLLWRFKDRVLSSALAWFSNPPNWSYGGNRLQVKAETHLLADVQLALERTAHIGLEAHGARKSLEPKQDLLTLLLGNEQTRLLVWLFPLDYEKKHHFTTSHHSRAPSDVRFSPLFTS
jgi:phosphatidylinositol 4-kinase